MNDTFHKTYEIAEDTYRISESGLVNCYLAIGKKKALLIDTGVGLGNIKDTVQSLTSLPVTVALTHLHPDHAGGVSHFETYWVSPDDWKFSYRFLSRPMFSRMMIQMAKVKNPEMPKWTADGHPAFLQKDQVFDLGDRTVRMISVPGHTAGSMAFIDDDHHLIFTGDDCNPSLWMHLPGCTSIETWKTGAAEILDYLKQGYTGWDGHDEKAQTLEQVQKTWDLAMTLLKQAEDPKWKGSGCIPSKEVFPQIRYKQKNILNH